MKFEVYAEVNSDQLYRRPRLSLIRQVEQHVENSFSSVPFLYYGSFCRQIVAVGKDRVFS